MKNALGLLLGITLTAGCAKAPAPTLSKPPAASASEKPELQRTPGDSSITFTAERYTWKQGEPWEVALTNRGPGTWVQDHAGGRNGCARFSWEKGLTLSQGSATWRTTSRGMLCTMAIVPPSTIVVQPGEVVPVRPPPALFADPPYGISTEPTTPSTPVTLEPGTYTLRVGGATALLAITG